MSGKRKWIPIAIGVVVLLFFIAVGAAIFAVATRATTFRSRPRAKPTR